MMKWFLFLGTKGENGASYDSFWFTKIVQVLKNVEAIDAVTCICPGKGEVHAKAYQEQLAPRI